MWNTLTSTKEQAQHILEREPRRDESDQAYFMVQENDSLEVNLDSHLDDCANTSNDEHDSMDAHVLNEELSLFCENLLSK